jgi:hypothetical protein
MGRFYCGGNQICLKICSGSKSFYVRRITWYRKTLVQFFRIIVYDDDYLSNSTIMMIIMMILVCLLVFLTLQTIAVVFLQPSGGF